MRQSRTRLRTQRTGDQWYWLRYYSVGALIGVGIPAWTVFVFWAFFW